MEKNLLKNSALVYTVSVFYLIAMWLITRNLLAGEELPINAGAFFYSLITILVMINCVGMSDEPIGVRLQGGILIVSLVGIIFSLIYNISLIWFMLAFGVGSFLLFCWGEIVREK